MSGCGERMEERREAIREESEQQELSSAQRIAVDTARQQGSAIDLLQHLQGTELWDRLTAIDLEDEHSEEYPGLEKMLSPYLTTASMLASHDADWYDDRSRKLLNENLADRIIRGREYGDLCTGEWRRIAQQVDGDTSVDLRKDLSQAERAAIRAGIEDGKTDRESLGDGTFFKGITEMHVSTEVNRGEGGENGKKRGGLTSLIPGMK